MSTHQTVPAQAQDKVETTESKIGFRKIGISAVVAAVEAGGHAKPQQMSASQAQTDIVSRKLAQMGSED
jgi:hypothetical protein